MADSLAYDVFLSHSDKDKAVVRPVAERLRRDGLKVWFDEWEIRVGDSIPAKIEEGLQRSRVLVLCMSAGAFGSDWTQLESQTFRFRDPLNRGRRFIPLRIDDAPIEGSLAFFPSPPCPTPVPRERGVIVKARQSFQQRATLWRNDRGALVSDGLTGQPFVLLASLKENGWPVGPRR
jgi:hypothetical protein